MEIITAVAGDMFQQDNGLNHLTVKPFNCWTPDFITPDLRLPDNMSMEPVDYKI